MSRQRDIVHRLRDASNDLDVEMTASIAVLLGEAADELARLRLTDAERAKKAAFSCGCGAKPLYLSQVFPQQNLTEAGQPNPSETPNGSAGDGFRIPPSSDPVHRMCDKALTQLGQQWQSKLDAAWGVKTPNDATPMAGSGPTVPANDRASDCSEDGRVRASASSIGNTHEPAAWGVVDDRGLQLALHPTPEHASHMARNFGVGIAEIVPLYRHKQQTLTDAERSAIKEASEFYVGTRTGKALSGLLERLGGGQ